MLAGAVRVSAGVGYSPVFLFRSTGDAAVRAHERADIVGAGLPAMRRAGWAMRCHRGQARSYKAARRCNPWRRCPPRQPSDRGAPRCKQAWRRRTASTLRHVLGAVAQADGGIGRDGGHAGVPLFPGLAHEKSAIRKSVWAPKVDRGTSHQLKVAKQCCRNRRFAVELWHRKS